MELRKKTYDAVFWSFIDKGGNQLVRFLVSLFLARLLMPEQFGIIGMAYVVTEMARVFVQSGFGTALIKNTEANEIDENSVFYFNIVVGALFTLFIIMISPLVGAFFNSKELVPVIQVLSINVLIGSFGTIHGVLLTKRIDFKKQTKVSFFSTLISGIVSIVYALKGFGVWALVIQAITRTGLSTIFMWSIYSWRPKLLFSYKSLLAMFKFGSNVFLNSIFNLLFQNIHTLVIGKYFSPIQLGYYTRAYQTQILPTHTIWSVIGRVMFPVFSKIKNDNEKLRIGMQEISENIAFVVFPFLIIGALVSKELFILIFGENWKPSIIMFKILCIGNIFYPLEKLRIEFVLARGRSDLQFKFNLFRNILILISIVFTYRYGINLMLIVYSAIAYLFFFISSYYVHKMVGYSINKQVLDLLPYLLCITISGLSILLLDFLGIKSILINFLLKSISGIGFYLITGFLFRLNALMTNIELIRSLAKRIKPGLV